MMLGMPRRSTGLVYQKLAPLVSDAFSSRVRSATAGNSAAAIRVSVMMTTFLSGWLAGRLDRQDREGAEDAQHDADGEEADVAEREDDRAGDGGGQHLRQRGGDVDDAEVLRERLRRG